MSDRVIDLLKGMIIAPAGSGGARVLEQLAAWEAAARGAYSANTQRAYRHDWNRFRGAIINATLSRRMMVW